MASEIHLDVAHVWQLDPDHPIQPNERRNMCAPAAANMVLDFLHNRLGQDSFQLAEIAERMQQYGGRVQELGWKHSAQVSALKSYGLTAWRRNWLAPSQDPQYFIDHEDYDKNQVGAFLTQLHSEEQGQDSVQDKAHYCIVSSLSRGIPVIVSVKAGFSENEIGHMVVVSGFSRSHVDIVDPILSAGQQQPVTWEYFWQYFKLQAIFVLPLPQ